MCGEEKGGIPFRPDVRSLGVWGLGTFRLEGMRHIVMPYEVGSARHGPFEASRLGLLFGSWEVPESVWNDLLSLRDPLRIASPLPPVQEWWGRPWHWTPGSSHLATSESGVSRLLGRNRQPVVPGVQDLDKLVEH
jgi:hypothetical protein